MNNGSFLGLWSVGNCESKRRGLCQRKMDSKPLGEKGTGKNLKNHFEET